MHSDRTERLTSSGFGTGETNEGAFRDPDVEEVYFLNA